MVAVSGVCANTAAAKRKKKEPRSLNIGVKVIQQGYSSPPPTTTARSGMRFRLVHLSGAANPGWGPLRGRLPAGAWTRWRARPHARSPAPHREARDNGAHAVHSAGPLVFRRLRPGLADLGSEEHTSELQ